MGWWKSLGYVSNLICIQKQGPIRNIFVYIERKNLLRQSPKNPNMLYLVFMKFQVVKYTTFLCKSLCFSIQRKWDLHTTMT